MSQSEKKQEIDEIKAQSFTTKRITVPALEEILYEELSVLDHGFIRVIDYMGDDGAVVQAARVSYGKGTKKISEDKGLINYLIRHRHTTPFEMCSLKLHVKLPIFVARQWIRHRTASINEYSARYSVMEDEFYIPTNDHLAAQSQTNRQGRGDVLTGSEAQRVLQLLKEDSEKSYEHYLEMLNQDKDGHIMNEDNSGLTRELARMNLPVNYYTQWYWKTNLHNLMHFLSLRADSHAQYEIRVYAEKILEIMKKWVPIAYEAFMEYRVGGTHISKTGIDIVKKMINGENPTREQTGMSAREWNELMLILGKM